MATQPWHSDRDLDERVAAETIAARFPGLAGKSVAYLDEGWDSCAFLVDSKWVFRLPKRKECEADVLCEIPLLKSLAGRLPVAIPEVAFDGGTFFGYRFLDGEGLSAREPTEALKRVLAPQFGAFFTALHNSPAPASLPVAPRNMGKLRERAIEAFSGIEGRYPQTRTARALLEAMPVEFAGEPVVVHNDFVGDHIRVAGDRISGVIDWSDARRGDPAADFAGLAHWAGPGFIEMALEHYERPFDAALAGRAAFAALCVGFLDLHYGVEGGRVDYVRMGLRALSYGIV